MSEAPALSIQIVTWNSEDVIGACLASLAAQCVRAFEVVIVDNASQDATAACVERALAQGLPGTLVRSGRNLGFCGGHNLALGRSQASWILLLNPDTHVGVDFVERTLETLQRTDPDVGTVAPLIVRQDGRIDSTGLFLDRLRRVFDRGQGKPAQRYAREEDVFGCTGAAALHRRAMLADVAEDGQAFDERLFAYYDDLDLSWRAQLRGWRCRYVPSLVVVHARAGRNAVRAAEGRRGRALEQRLAVRNRLLVLLKCERLRDALAALPWLLPYELARLAYVALRAPGSLPGYLDALRLAPTFWRSRRLVRQRAHPARLLAAPFFPHAARDAS
ncbi:MAG: glycosyltransferase family 2 protein [Deltaproteobacteria bacterium]|nr:glycosyltransferase family 2 protein [Deltaproteobacteria bacterium]